MNLKTFEARVKKILGNRLDVISYTKRRNIVTGELAWGEIYVHTNGHSSATVCEMTLPPNPMEKMLELLEREHDVCKNQS